MIEKIKTTPLAKMAAGVGLKETPKKEGDKSSTTKKAVIATACVGAAIALAYFTKSRMKATYAKEVTNSLLNSKKTIETKPLTPIITYVPPKKVTNRATVMQDLRSRAVDTSFE